MKSTQELEHQTRQSRDPALLAEDAFSAPDLTAHLRNLLSCRDVSVQDVVVGCRLDRSYGYQLFNGTRKPTRNFLLRLALFLKLREEEVQRLLNIAERQPLYARNRRDAAVLYGLTHGLAADETQELLEALGEEGLE